MGKKSYLVEKNPLPASLFSKPNAKEKTKLGSSAALEVYLQASHLKNIYRRAWLKFLPKEKIESDGDRVFGVTLLSMLLANESFPELDKRKVLEMALVHELGEAYTGDIVPDDKVPHEKKFRGEKIAVEKIFSSHPQGKKYLQLWHEFEEGKTPEARFVKQIDRLELALQTIVYQAQSGKDISEFIEFSQKSIYDPRLRKIFDEALELKKKRGD